LTDQDRAQLTGWARRATSANALAVRSRIVLAATEGLSTSAVARRLDINVATARRWRPRFLDQGLEGLLDEPHPGRPRTVADEQVEQVITRTLETSPNNATHWSTRALAAELGLSQTSVSRIWRAFGLQPHRQDSWKRNQREVNAAHARQRGPGERANAQLESWRILRKIRCCPHQTTSLVKAVPVLILAD